MKTSGLNLCLILVGLALMMIGLYRTFPLKFDVRFLWGSGPMIIAFVVVIVLAAWTGGMKYLLAGFDGTIATSSSFMLTLVLLMPIIGFSAPVAHHFETAIGNALEGPFGYLWAIIASFLTPSSNAMSGVVGRIWVTNPNVRPVLLYFLNISALTSLTIFFIRQLGLGTEIAWQMYKTNWVSAIFMAPCFWVSAKIVERFFS